MHIVGWLGVFITRTSLFAVIPYDVGRLSETSRTAATTPRKIFHGRFGLELDLDSQLDSQDLLSSSASSRDTSNNGETS